MIKEDEWKQFEEVKKGVTFFLKENEDAIRFCMDIWKVCHIWDDIVDKDNPTYEEVCDAFRIALIDINLNPFFSTFRSHLVPIMMNIILQWEDSNTLDHGSDHDKHMSYMLRAAPVGIVNFCALLVGGPNWARKVGPDIRRIMIEDFDSYMKEMNSFQKEK
jgi:hypothetical protein